MNERIEQLLEEIKMSPSLFADTIGVQRATISHILSGRNNPSLDFVQKVLSRFPELNPDWILSGKGDMWRKPLVPRVEKVIDDKDMILRSENNQPELFADLNPQPNTADTVTVSELKKPVKTEGKIRDRSSQTEGIEVRNDVSSTNELSAKQLSKVILLYNDGTFESYIP